MEDNKHTQQDIAQPYQIALFEDNVYVRRGKGTTISQIKDTRIITDKNIIESVTGLMDSPYSNKYDTLVKERELLIEALNDILYSWNKRMSGDTEELKTTNINGDIIEFWSPIASLIDSEPIHKAKELLNNLQK